MAIFIKQDNQLIELSDTNKKVIIEPDRYLGFSINRCYEWAKSKHTAIANKKYYISNYNYNNIGFKNKLWLIAFPTSYSGINIEDCNGYIELTENQTVTGTLVWGWSHHYFGTSSSMTLGVDGTGPYVLFPQNTQIGSSGISTTTIPFMIKINNINYYLFIELGGTIVNRNKSPIGSSSSETSTSTRIECRDSTFNVTSLRESFVNSYNINPNISPDSYWVNTVLNENGSWHKLCNVYLHGSLSGNIYYTFIYSWVDTLPNGIEFKL